MPCQRTRAQSTHSESDPDVPVAEAICSDGVATATPGVDPLTVAEPAGSLPTVQLRHPAGKLGMIVEMAAAVTGTTLDELAAVTGWQAHTIRAALSRLRQRGIPIVLTNGADGRKAYRLDGREG